MKKILLILLLILTMMACTKNSDNSDLDDNDDSNSEYTTDCGVVVDGQLELPIDADRGFIGSAVITAPDQAIFTSGSGQIVIKLQGIAASGNAALNSSAVEFLNDSLRGGQAIFFPADGECSVIVAGGGEARVGALFTRSGTSLNEALLGEGLVLVDTNPACSANLITTCYQALSEQGGSDLLVSNFLWKPVSERDGNLVVLLNPSNARVVVSGTELTDNGPSNGRGTTARANRSGASFGTNITVQAFDQLGRAIRFPNGEDRYIIANGSQRVEFQ